VRQQEVFDESLKPSSFAAFLSSSIVLFMKGMVVVSNAVSSVRERFMGKEYSLILGMVAILSPLYLLLAEGAVNLFFFEKQFGLLYFIFKSAG
jgi:hypothetical protein